MMSGRFGELLLILLIVLLLFGAGRLPRLMADVGRSMRSLRQGLAGEEGDEILELRATDSKPHASSSSIGASKRKGKPK